MIISEVEPQQFVTRFSLLERNRITSGISDSVLLVTSEPNGGTIEQYKIARQQNKKILVPFMKLEPRSGIEKIMNVDPTISVIGDSAHVNQIPDDRCPVLQTRRLLPA